MNQHQWCISAQPKGVHSNLNGDCYRLWFSVALALVSLAISSGSFAQSTALRPPTLSVGGGLADNLSHATINAFDGSVLCGVFTNGARNCPLYFAQVSLPFENSRWSFSPRLTYQDLSTNFQIQAEPTGQEPKAYRLQDGAYIPITRTRTYAANLSTISAQLFATYNLFQSLHIELGPSIGIIAAHSFEETEHIAAPSGAVYSQNSLTSRTIGSGLVATNALQLGVGIGVGYDLVLQPHVSLRPSLNALLPITQISSDKSWRIYPVSAALALVYSFDQATVVQPPLAVAEPLATNPATPVIAEKKSVLDVTIKAVGVGVDGEDVEEPVLSVERMHVTEVYPMLNYIFFEDGSNRIADRYEQSTAISRHLFDERSLFTANALDIHHHVLDILGKRLSERPTATITIVGTHSEHSPLDSAAGSDLSIQRAKAVADYLNQVWAIGRERLAIRGKALPDSPSDDKNPTGQAENRRVEIVPSTADITAPLWAERIERIATPPKINFDEAVVSSAGVKSAVIKVRQGDRVLQTIDALTEGSVGQYIWTLGPNSMPETNDSLTYTFTVTDSTDHVATATGVIHLKQIARDTSVHRTEKSLAGRDLERFSLILFDYSSSQIEKKQANRILVDIAHAVGTDSRLTLTGHTDRTGDDEFNERLAESRVTHAAQLLSQMLKQSKGSATPMRVESHGSRDVLFDNSIPEGRLLSRTVRAVIEHEVSTAPKTQ